MSLLTATTERIGCHLVVRVRGEVDITTAPILEQVLREGVAAEPPPGAVFADLSEVGFFDSSGLSVLLAAHSQGRDSGVPLIIVAPLTGMARRSMQVTGVDHLLTVTETLDDALGSEDTC